MPSKARAAASALAVLAVGACVGPVPFCGGPDIETNDMMPPDCCEPWPDGGAGDAAGESDASGPAKDAKDAAPDAPEVTPWDGGGAWKPLPWNPWKCAVRQAVDPAAALPPEKWLPCGGTVAGCTYLDTSQIPGDEGPNPSKLGQYVAVGEVAGAVVYVAAFWMSAKTARLGVFQLGLGPRVVLEPSFSTLEECVVGGPGSVSGGRVALGVRGEVSPGAVGTRVAYGSVDEFVAGTPSYIDMDKSVTGFTLFGIPRASMSSTRMAFEIVATNDIFVWDYGPGKPVKVPKPADVNDQHDVTAIGDYVLFERYGLPSGWAISLVQPDGKAVDLVQKPAVWPTYPGGDEKTIVWQELDVTDAGSGWGELWASPFATTPAAMKPKKLRNTLPSTFAEGAYLGGGWYVYDHHDTFLRAVRVTDGYYLDVPSPPGYGWARPLGVVNGEVWGLLHKFVDAGQGIVNTIARVPIASLGEPKP